MVNATDIHCYFMCKEASKVSVALMEMSMKISTWSLMRAQQNKGKVLTVESQSRGNTKHALEISAKQE